jgi:hypothetical protein
MALTVIGEAPLFTRQSPSGALVPTCKEPMSMVELGAITVLEQPSDTPVKTATEVERNQRKKKTAAG